MKKIQSIALTALLGVVTVLGVSACESDDINSIISEFFEDDQPVSESVETVETVEPTIQSGDAESITWTPEIAPDYFVVTGNADINFDVEEGDFFYCNLDQLGRAGCAVSMMTTETREEAKSADRKDIGSFSPTGWGHNEEVEIVSANPAVEGNYRGWFYNRSHMIADSLGGDAALENLVTGTRPQNVGNRNNQGGMAYTEGIARDYLDSPDAIGCPLYYAVEAQYDGDDLLPKTTTVDMKVIEQDGQSCNTDIDMHVIVFNEANGFVVNHSTGEFSPAK